VATILILFFLVLSGVGESAEPNTISKPPVSKNEDFTSDDKRHKANDSKVNKSQPAENESEAGIERGPRAPSNRPTNYPNGDADQFWVWPPTSGWAVVYITAVYAFVGAHRRKPPAIQASHKAGSRYDQRSSR
jgi:hypothetical protein